MALLNAEDNTSLASINGLSHSDALLNIQQNGTIHLSDALTETINPDGSRTYRLDLTGIPANTAATLYFDLLGFGKADSHITIRDVRLIAQPELNDDTAITTEDTPVQINAMANDINTDIEGFYPVVVQSAEHGQVSVNTDSTFTYTPSKDWSGIDTFTYKMSNGDIDSNIATVTVAVIPINDVPVVQDATLSTQEDTPITLALLPFASDIDSSTLTPSIVQGPQHGVLNQNVDGTYTYIPNADWNGTDSFSYKASDGELDSNIATVTLNVVAVNDAPIAQDIQFNTNEDAPLSFSLASVIRDIDSNALTVQITQQPQHGILMQNADGTFIYQPNKDWYGSDSFIYKANDGSLESNLATVTFVVAPVNDAPVVQSTQFSTQEDTAITISLTSLISDIDSTSLITTIVTSPVHGTLTRNASGTFTYKPAQNWNGTDTFSYKANDGELDSNVAKVTIVVTPVNDAPVAQNIQLNTKEDTPFTFSLFSQVDDVDSTSLSIKLVNTPQYGTLVQNANGTFTYQPNKDWFGIDSFSYKANDGELDSNIATVTITVKPVNDAPIAQNTQLNVQGDTTLNISLTSLISDVDSTTLTTSIVTGPTHGKLIQNTNGTYTYSPDNGWSGTDSFTYKANDGQLDSGIAKVTINVTAVNTAPVWTSTPPSIFRLQPSTDGIFKISGNTGTQTTLSFTLSDRQAAYKDEVGLYKVDDATGRIGNLMPGDAGYAQAALSASRTITLFAGNDKISGTISVTLDAGQYYGSYLIQNSTLDKWRSKNPNSAASANALTAFFSVIQANPDGMKHVQSTWTNGTLKMAWEDLMGGGDQDFNDVVITANGLQTSTINRFTYQANASDKDGDVLTYKMLQAPAGSTLDTKTGLLVWDNPTIGIYTFRLQVDDGRGGTAEQSFTLTVTGQPPVAKDAQFSTQEDHAVQINLATLISDVDSSNVTANIMALPTHGKLIANADGTLSYIPNANWYGTDSFSYKANDGQSDSNIANITITVISVNDAPVAANAAFSSNEDTAIKIDFAQLVKDVDNTSLKARIIEGPRHGKLVANQDGSISYIPDENWNGTDNFTYVGNDGNLDSNLGTVTIRVNSVNDAPTALNATVKVGKNSSIKLDLEDLVGDVDCDDLTITVSNPTHGTLKNNKDDTYTYTPDKNYTGSDSFNYTVSDGQTSTTAKISIIVANNGSSSITVTSIAAAATSTPSGLKNNTSFNIVAPSTADNTVAPVIDWSGAAALCSTSAYQATGEDAWMLEVMGIKKEEDKQDLASITGLKIILKDNHGGIHDE